jgi:hypothetical protein
MRLGVLKFGGAVIATTCLLLAGALPAHAQETCRVYIHSGAVRITGPDGTRSVEASAEVRDGESIEALSSITVAFLRVGPRIDQVAPGSAQRVACKGMAREKQEHGKGIGAFERLTRLVDLLLVETTASSKPLGYRTGPKESDVLERLRVLYPTSNSKVLSPTPAFAWNLAGGAYRVSVTSVDPEVVVWSRVVAGVSALAYPADAAPLALRQTYVLQVENVADSRQGAFSTFSVATDSERANMQREVQELERRCGELRLRRSECVLAIAGLYLQAGFGNDAMQVIVAAQSQGADEPTLALLLGRLLAPSSPQQ